MIPYCLSEVTVRVHPGQVDGGSVSQDWRKPLSSEKSRAYFRCVQSLENSYGMFSVNLDEALGLRRRGRTATAYQVLGVAPALCRRMAWPLTSLLNTMLEHAKHFGTTPNILPLDSENFQHARSQRAARLSDLFSKVLLTRKSQFVHTMTALSSLVSELDASFESTIEELREEQSLLPERDWEVLDCVHYDLNTCLRQTVVLFKSFLHALPEEQLSEFEASLASQTDRSAEALCAPTLDRHLAHRRIAFLKGQ
jgi:hypothetical protein